MIANEYQKHGNFSCEQEDACFYMLVDARQSWLGEDRDE